MVERWSAGKGAIGRPTLRVHDLRHTATSSWLAAVADPKVVRRVLGHVSAAMTMDLYGHPTDRKRSDTAARLGLTSEARRSVKEDDLPGRAGVEAFRLGSSVGAA
jgi:integrase